MKQKTQHLFQCLIMLVLILAASIGLSLTFGNMVQAKNLEKLSDESYHMSFSCKRGEYCAVISYIPGEDDLDIYLSISLDGKELTDEQKIVKLPRCWVSEDENYFDEAGNEYAGYLIQDRKLMKERLRDEQGLECEDLSFELEGGEHELQIEVLSGSLEIKNISFEKKKELPSYEEYLKKQIEKNGDCDYTGNAVMVEGEAVSSRSDRDIPCYSYQDAAMSPCEPGKIRINAFGGGYWYKGNSSGTWEFIVPEDGFYKLSLRVLQNNEGLVSNRQILIDGKVPFQELNSYSFFYDNEFRTEEIGAEEPYKIWLAAGEHTLTIRAVSDYYKDNAQSLTEIAEELLETVQNVQKITGVNPDYYFDYELDKKIPGILDTLVNISAEIEKNAKEIDTLCKQSPAITSTLYGDAKTIQNIASDPKKIPNNLDMLTTIQGDLNDAAATLLSQPLSIDWISFQNPEEEKYEPKKNLLLTAKIAVFQFLNSFSEDGNEEDHTEGKTINLWVSRDKEWGNIIQKLIREDFEKNNNIKVNINVLPSGNTTVVNGSSPLLLSVIAGNTPDIALGCDSKTPIELAIRNQLTDLSEFSDFEEVKERFPEYAIEALSYEKGYYGVPETVDVPVMVCRTDILEANGIEVPETWKEMMERTLPQLAQIDANFYLGSSSPDIYTSMLYQYGGNLYGEDGECLLNSSEAVEAFEQWTKCFVQYNIPQSANFYNEMRKGTLPIGVCSLAEYMELKTYAGELSGKLKIYKIPGVEQGNGEVRHDSCGTLTSGVIFRDSSCKEECWTFLKWWTSAEVQQRFAMEIETRVGATGRWFSANKNAISKLSWSRQELSAIEEVIPEYRNFYNVLGGYYSSRSITNAWTRTVLMGERPRDSIEQSYDEIRIQIERKRREYGKRKNHS